ncbi:MAG TPA: YdcF family protein [Bryobacteraceae bacterium]|nr:YdcF family protein [Bryobacteraceae bacterium]
MALGRSLKHKLLFTALFLVVLFFTHSIWFGWMAEALVHSDQPFHAGLIVAIAGDPYGHRILKAAELVKQGYAPQILVSGAPGFYDLHENDLAIPFAVRRGYPAQWFIPFPHEAHSTDEEAQAIIPELRRRGVRRVILVTSDYHSRRALRTFRKYGPDIDMRMVAVPDPHFNPHGWWRSREGRKIFFLEWSKTLASLAGL